MKSGIKGLIYTFIATLAIYALIKNEIFPKKKPLSMRFLNYIDDLKDSFCSKSSEELEEFYKSTSPNYEFFPKGDNEFLQKIMKDFILNGTNPQELGVDELKEYFSKSPGYILILILFIFLCILYFPYLLCVCCKCCFCIPDCCSQCPNFMIIVGLVFCGLTLINCFVGYSENRSIVDGVYGLGCSILKIEDHLVNGDDFREEKPYWIGITGIFEKLEDISKNITALEQKTKDIRLELENEVGPLFQEFSEALDNEYKNRKTSTVSNPDPDKKDVPYIPLYLKTEGKYGPPDNSNSTLGFIKTELDLYKAYSFNYTYMILYIIGNASHAESYIDTSINEIKSNLETNINNVDNSIIDKIFKYEETLDEIDRYSRNYMNIFFTVNLILVLILGSALILLLVCKEGLFLLCLSWLLLYKFMVCTFFIGAVFGLIGSFVQDASAGVKSLITNIDNIKQIDQQAKDIANICLNGNGSLAETGLIPLEFNKSMIEGVYSLENNFKEANKKLKDYIPFSTTANLEIYNLITKTKQFIPELQSTLNGIKKYIDSSYSQSVLDSESIIYDNWEINITECEDGYKYCSKESLKVKNMLQETEKCCLLITEWDLSEIKGRYKGLTAKDKSISIEENVEKYYNTIIDFIDSNNQLISEIIEKNKEFNKTFNDIGLEEIKIIEKIEDLFKPLREGFDDIVGNKPILEILNCKFLKRDVNKIIEVLYDSFGQTFKTTSSLLLMISGYELAMTLIVMIIMKAFGMMKKNTYKVIEKK